MEQPLWENCPIPANVVDLCACLLSVFHASCVIGMYDPAPAGVAVKPVGDLMGQREEINRGIVDALKVGAFADQVVAMTQDDAAKGRMSRPRRLRRSDLSHFNLSPRFCIQQGECH